MSAAYRAALAALSAIRHRLADQDLTEAARALELVEFDRVLQALQRGDHRANTLALARRVRGLDTQLADRPPAERNKIIQQRLGLSRSRLYELRSVQLSPDGNLLK
jgi:hypothetical protein